MPDSPREIAAALAPRCRQLRDAARAALEASGSQVRRIAAQWRQRVGDVDDAGFADDYAQSVMLALLTAGSDPGERGPLAWVRGTLEAVREELAGPLEALERAVAAIDGGGEGAWYEHFLAAYDPRLRREAGAYYTPIEVVRAQIALVGELLARELGRPGGFADPGVVTIDPACGTGAYPLAIAACTLEQVRRAGGDVAAAATGLGRGLVALEVMAGPCAVAHLRLSATLRDAGASLPPEGAQVRRGDTLATSGALGELAPGRVGVCIGNPPYDRQTIAAGASAERRGGWVRHGAGGERAILADFVPSADSGAGQHAKNLYNDYVYFWRWALWHVFERRAEGGVVCFVTASSFLRGPGFVAMRRHMRAILDELWIVDLGGEALGPRPSANVFAIRTPVCVAVGLRRGRGAAGEPARVWYARLPDALDRAGKLARLGEVRGFGDLEWARASDGWDDPFVPTVVSGASRWPRLADLCPWQRSGAQWKRTWPIGETRELLERRWRALMDCEDRRAPFRESEAWTVARPGADLRDGSVRLPPIASLSREAPCPPIRRYAWRALDRQWCIADGRLGDRLRPALWQIDGERQIYLTTLMSSGLSRGPALVACAHVPDLHHFRGSFGDRGVIPLWRDAAATRPNVAPGLLAALAARYGRTVAAEELFAYIHGCLAHPGYYESLVDALAEAGPRVPMTADARRFEQMVALGRELLRLQTFGERMGDGAGIGGVARCLAAIPGDDYPATFRWADEALRVGQGVFAPVSRAVWDYEVSGLRVVASWLGFRMQRPRGRRSSPLDLLRPEVWTEAMTAELLELLWVVEGSLAVHRRQAVAFAELVAGPLLPADALPGRADAVARPDHSGAAAGRTRAAPRGAC